MFNQTGWICPNCGMGCSPMTMYCCKPVTVTTTNIGTFTPEHETLSLCKHRHPAKICPLCIEIKLTEGISLK